MGVFLKFMGYIVVDAITIFLVISLLSWLCGGSHELFVASLIFSFLALFAIGYFRLQWRLAKEDKAIREFLNIK